MFFLTSRSKRVLLFVLAVPAFAGSSIHGVKNFHQVDEHVFRGAQPTDEGFDALAKLGIKTVIDLREQGPRSSAEEKYVTAAGMSYVSIPMTGLTPPTQSEITRILALPEDTSKGPVFVHCMRGADRTGAVIAAYRIDHDLWDSGRALSEAKSLGMGFFQLPRQNFIRGFEPRAVAAKADAPPAPSSDVTVTPAAR